MFQGGYANEGGAIYIIGDAALSISSSMFIRNTGENRGGAIMAESFGSLNISEGCIFDHNTAINDTGDTIYASTSSKFISISNSFFQQTKASQFLYINYVTQVSINTSILALSSCYYHNVKK